MTLYFFNWLKKTTFQLFFIICMYLRNEYRIKSIKIKIKVSSRFNISQNIFA